MGVVCSPETQMHPYIHASWLIWAQFAGKVWVFKCNYLCKLKDISGRLRGCAGPCKLISSKDGFSTSEDVICSDGYFRSHFTQALFPLDVRRLANEEAGETQKSDTARIEREFWPQSDGFGFGRLC